MTKTLIADLTTSLGADRILTSDQVLNSRRYDRWALSWLKDWLGEPMATPGAVARPRTVDEVQRIVVAANASGTALIPFGLGSGVCGGVLPTPDAILLDLSTLNQVRFIDETNLLASFDAGKNGLEAEEAVAAKGLTIGPLAAIGGDQQRWRLGLHPRLGPVFHRLRQYRGHRPIPSRRCCRTGGWSRWARRPARPLARTCVTS